MNRREHTKKRIGLLGGGIASLATAYQLIRQRDDLELVILEKEPAIGGLARSMTIEGLPVDLGPHRIFTEIPEIKEFLREFLSDQWFLVQRKSQMYYQGVYIDYPIKPLSVLKYLGLLTTLKFGVGAVLAALLPSVGADRQTFESVLKKAFGGVVYEDLMRPYMEKVWKMSPADIDAEVGRLRVSAGGLEKMLRQIVGREKENDPSAVKEFYYLPNGFQDMVDKYTHVLANKAVTFITNAQIVGVHPDTRGGIKVQWDSASGVHDDTFDFCFSTIPVDDLVRMLHEHRPNDKAKQVADRLRYLSMILVYVVANRPQISDNGWLYFPEKDLIFNRGYEGKNFNPLVKTDKSVICLEVTCYQGDEVWTRDDDDVAREVVRAFCSTGMLTEREVDRTVVTRLSHAYPILHKGYKKDLQTLWNYLSQTASLMTLGRQGLFQHNNTDHSQFMGFLAADLFLRSDTPVRDWYQSEIKKFDHFRIVD